MSIVNNIILLNRGDSYSFDLTIADENATDGRYRLTGDDTVYFGIMDPGQPFEFALIRKRYTVEDTDEAGNLFITLEPDDTVNLFPGKYYYSIKLHQNHDEVFPDTLEPTGLRVDKVITIIPKTKFIICD